MLIINTFKYKKEEGMNRQRLLVYILVILLAAAIGYIAFDAVQESLNEQAQTIFQNGYSQGVTDAVVSLYQQTENCQPTVITVGNFTKELVDTACLVQAPAQE